MHSKEIIHKPLTGRILGLSTVLAFFSTLSLCLSLRVINETELIQSMGIENPHKIYKVIWDFHLSLDSYHIYTGIIWVALSLLFGWILSKNIKHSCSKIILALAYTFFQIFGSSFNNVGSWDQIFSTKRNIIKSTISSVGYFALFYLCILGLTCFLDRIEFQKKDVAKVNWFTNNRKSIFVVAVLILLLWLPALIAYFPGMTNYDFFDGLNSFYGIDTNSIRVTVRLDPNVTLNNNNPVLQTLLGVGVMKIGTLFGSPYIGLFLFVTIQTLCYAFALSYMIYFLAYKGVSRKIRVGVLLLFGIMPVHPNYAFTTLKDTNWSFVILLYVIGLVELLTNTDDFLSKFRKPFGIFVLALLVLFLRNNGLYVVLFTTISIVVVLRKNWKKLVFPMIMPLVFYFFVTSVIYPALKISPGNAVAAYSAPVQQLARLATEQPDAISEKDKEIINQVFDFERFATAYNPELADPVMSSYQKDRTEKEWDEFIGVWLRYLKRYPMVFIQATMNGSYGYFYPSAHNWITYSEITPPAEPYGLKPFTKLEPFHSEMVKFAYVFGSVPGIGMLVSIGFYTWWLFFILVYLMHRKCMRSIVVLVPFFTILLTSIASPSNTMFRYAYPIIVCVPVVFSLLGVLSEKTCQ